MDKGTNFVLIIFAVDYKLVDREACANFKITQPWIKAGHMLITLSVTDTCLGEFQYTVVFVLSKKCTQLTSHMLVASMLVCMKYHSASISAIPLPLPDTSSVLYILDFYCLNRPYNTKV